MSHIRITCITSVNKEVERPPIRLGSGFQDTNDYYHRSFAMEISIDRDMLPLLSEGTELIVNDATYRIGSVTVSIPNSITMTLRPHVPAGHGHTDDPERQCSFLLKKGWDEWSDGWQPTGMNLRRAAIRAFEAVANKWGEP